MDKARICPGHPDDRFIEMIEKCLISVATTIDSALPVVLNGTTYIRAVRTQSCDILVVGSKCATCVKYRSVLRALFNKESKKRDIIVNEDRCMS